MKKIVFDPHFTTTNDRMTKENVRLQYEAINISYLCQYNEKLITKLFLATLTNCNFHALREKLAKLVNKELKCKLRIKG